jgi:hypothetical protein
MTATNLGELGPAMKALPNDRWREFVYHYTRAMPRKGALVAAYRAAGFGQGSTPASQAKAAWLMSRDERTIAAIAEESKKILRVAYPEGANALINLIRDPTHKDHGRALGMLMDRVFPVETRHNIEVVHKTVDPDLEAIEELRALRQLGTSREKLIELFGASGLPRIEALESADAAQRAEKAKVIDDIKYEDISAEAPDEEGIDNVDTPGSPQPVEDFEF